MEIKTIFLASSNELSADREAFRKLLSKDNDNNFEFRGIYYKLIVWENFNDSLAVDGSQETYNEAIRKCDYFILLYCSKVWKYTDIEFNTAHEQFEKTGKPAIRIYYKNALIKSGSINKTDTESLEAFNEKLKQLKHFKTEYETTDGLVLLFKEQLDIISSTSSNTSNKNNFPHCLSAGQPAVTNDFMGRDIELADIKTRLEKNKLLLVNGEGGMGKTSITAKYLIDHKDKYQHYAWLFCDNGINEEIKKLAPKLGIDLTKIAEEKQLGEIKLAMENLPGDCLLILDNANNPEHLKAFQKEFTGTKWQVLITSRCEKIFSGNEYTLAHLKEDKAKELFRTYYTEDGDEFDKLLDKLLKGIGYNTLLIELFGKNMKELSALGETLQDFVNQFKEKGLFLGDRSFEINTLHEASQQRSTATTDQIIETLYDVTKLEEKERYLLVNLALLPPESQPIILLLEAFMPENKIAFTKELKALAQKGWLNTDISTYRMSPVVQGIILNKNKETLWDDGELLVNNLNKNLESKDGFLANLSYDDAQPFAEYARSVSDLMKKGNFKIALLFLFLSDYHLGIGNLGLCFSYLEKATVIFKDIDQNNYMICILRLGDIYLKLAKFEKALEYYKLRLKLGKSLYTADPTNIFLKSLTAVTYSRLGAFYQKQGNYKKALGYFKQDLNLTQEIYNSNTKNESFKNSLAISFGTIGQLYQICGSLKKALTYFKKVSRLYKSMYLANRYSESIKNGLTKSYSSLGDIYFQEKDFKKALRYFEQDLALTKELYLSNKNSMELSSGLAVSYSKLAFLYSTIKEPEKAISYYKDAEKIWFTLVEKAGIPEYQYNLGWVRNQLKELEDN